MDEHKLLVELGGKFHRMEGVLFLLYPGKQPIHLLLYLLRGCYRILGAGDKYPDLPVASGIRWLNVLIKQFMHLQHRLLINASVLKHGKHIIIGFRMVHRLEHVPQRFSPTVSPSS